MQAIDYSLNFQNRSWKCMKVRFTPQLDLFGNVSLSGGITDVDMPTVTRTTLSTRTGLVSSPNILSLVETSSTF